MTATPTLRYLASDKGQRVNVSDHYRGRPVTSTVRVGHWVRGDYTLCGHRADRFAWVEPDERTTRCADCGVVPAGYFTSVDLIASTGLTYRQVDYWCRRGWLRPDVSTPGSGTRRVFPPAEHDVARVMASLTGAGVAPEAAARVARGGDLAPGVVVSLDDRRARACAAARSFRRHTRGA